MASEVTPSKPKKARADQKREALEVLLGQIKKHLASKNFEELLKDLERAKKLITSQDAAKRVLACQIEATKEFASNEDQRQSLICVVGYIKEKAALYSEALQELIVIAERNNEAMEIILSIVHNNYAKFKSDKFLGDFLNENEKSSQPNIILLRAIYAIQKISNAQKTINFFAGVGKAEPNWSDVLRNALILLKRIPDKFAQLLDIKTMGSRKVVSVMDHQRIVEVVISVFDKAEEESVDSLLEFLKGFKSSELYEKKCLDEQVVAVIQSFLKHDKSNQLHSFLVEMYEKNGRSDDAQEIRKKLQSTSEPEESHQAFSDEKEEEGAVFEKGDVEFQKRTVKGLKEEALLRNEASMQRLLEYSRDAKFSALAEVWEALGEIYVTVGAYKKGGKSAFEYVKKNVPEKCFDDARSAFEKFYKNKPRPGIYYDLAVKYREGRLFRKNTFLARRFVEEGRKNNDLNTDGLILLASMYFWGEGGIEKYEEAKEILDALNHDKKLDDKPDALYILAECEYLFYLNAEVDGRGEAAKEHKVLAQALFQRAEALRHPRATLCLELFSENIGEKHDGALQPMELGSDEEDHRDVAVTGIEDDDPHKIEKLLTELCEALRVNHNNEQHPEVVSLKARLVDLDASYEKCTPKNLFEKLKVYETEQGTYFDKEVSDDSDSDRDEKYHGNDHDITAKKQDANKLIGKLRKQTEEFLSILERSDEDKLSKEYKKYSGDFKSKYTPILKTMEANKNPSMEARRDLETVMDYAARGELSEALAQISTPFYVAQTRGLHFFVDKWSRQNRKEFKASVYNKEHPLLNQPVYSAAVHELAKVDERFPADPLSRLKLQQAARCLSYRLGKLHSQRPHAEGALPSKLKTKSIVERKYENRLTQVQQLYSGMYDNFLEEYLPWELQQEPHFFANEQMHFVSTADSQSKHGAQYAVGNKYYPSKKDSRLRPRYDHELRAKVLHVGATLLTLHPLEDFLPERHNHIPSLNTQGKIELSEEIVAERECTFFGSISEGRLSHIDIIRFPSFHHTKYLEVMRHRYGLDKDFYQRFKELLRTTRPHEAKNRLTILLLGEHIASYRVLKLQKRSDSLIRHRGDVEYLKDRDKEAGVSRAMKEDGLDRSYLLYRTPMGNFSFFADQPYAATPKGDNVFLRSRRFQTAALRKAARASGNYSDEESGSEEAKKEEASARVLTLGDGNCAFNAVTLGVLELLEEGLLPENVLFDLELAQKVGIEKESREALIEAIKKVKDPKERQQRFQLLMRQIAITQIEKDYERIHATTYHDTLIASFKLFKDGRGAQDDIFWVHRFIQDKFMEDNLDEDSLTAWWIEEGKDNYFDELRKTAKSAFAQGQWGGENEIDAFGKFLGIKISWRSSRMPKVGIIGAHLDNESIPVAFGVYFQAGHWSYVRLPKNSVLPEKQEQDEVSDSATGAAVEQESTRKPSTSLKK